MGRGARCQKGSHTLVKGTHWAEIRSLLLEGSVEGPLKSEHKEQLFLFSESWQASKLIWDQRAFVCDNWVLLQTSWRATLTVGNPKDLFGRLQKKLPNGSKIAVYSDIFINFFWALFPEENACNDTDAYKAFLPHRLEETRHCLPVSNFHVSSRGDLVHRCWNSSSFFIIFIDTSCCQCWWVGQSRVFNAFLSPLPLSPGEKQSHINKPIQMSSMKQKLKFQIFLGITIPEDGVKITSLLQMDGFFYIEIPKDWEKMCSFFCLFFHEPENE